MRIGFIADYFWPHIGGMETWTLEVSKELVKRGHHVVVYTHKIRGHVCDGTVDGVEVRRFGIESLSTHFNTLQPFPFFARLLAISLCLPLRLLQDDRPQLFVAAYVPLSLMGLLLKLIRLPTWGIIHGFYPTPSSSVGSGFTKGLLRFALENFCLKMPVTGFIVVGNEIRRSLVARGVDASKIHVIRGGVDLAVIDSVDVARSTTPQVCFVSRLVPERRLDELIYAFAIVLSRVSQARLVVVGDGPLLRRWEALAQSIKLGHRIRFTGGLNGRDKIAIMKESKLLVHPSLREGTSLTIYESLACGTPVVAYDIPEIREQLHLTGGGVLVPPHNTESLADAISNLLLDSEKRERLAHQGRRAVVRDFQWGNVVDNILRIVSARSAKDSKAIIKS